MVMHLLLLSMLPVLAQAAPTSLRKPTLLHANSTSKVITDQNSALNVHNQPLGFCSTSGSAMTGFTRDGRCADVGPADQGAHHICIQMPSNNNFCTVTGQPNWCSQHMPCHDGFPDGGDCPIENWCVCQWAFARYIQMAGGCDSIDTVHCDATNLAAVQAYQGSSDATHQAALACLQAKCGI
mmetsp:Transcript_30914/g.56996  ORF Transcript_30914/g.56996 Transcript_30914/m.56996 type:complete len:182 (+) Transcript_30914:69-614(+)